MDENYCSCGIPIWEDDYSYCEVAEDGQLLTPPVPVVVALYCQLKDDYCEGYDPEKCNIETG